MTRQIYCFCFWRFPVVYIWFPRNLSWRNFKPVLWFRRGLKGKARNFNWHNTIGFWTSLVLIILTVTGVVISYQWAGNLLYTLTGNEVAAATAATAESDGKEQEFVLPENLDEMFAKAENQTAWKTISLRLPVTNDSAVFTIDEGIYWNKFGRSTLTIDAKTLRSFKMGILRRTKFRADNFVRGRVSRTRAKHSAFSGNSSPFSPASAARFWSGREFLWH